MPNFEIPIDWIGCYGAASFLISRSISMWFGRSRPCSFALPIPKERRTRDYFSVRWEYYYCSSSWTTHLL